MIRLLAKVAMLGTMLLVAVAAGSLTLLAEACRLMFGWACADWNAWANRHARRAGGTYEYGGAKLGHAGGFLVAAAGLAAGLWIAALAMERLLAGGDLGPLGLAAAAVTAAPRGIQAGLMQRWGAGTSAVSVSTLVTILVPIGLTGAALAPDHTLGLCIDALLALGLSVLMIVLAIGDASAAVRDMIDHPLPPHEERRLAGLLQVYGIGSGELLAMRSRRAGRELILEVLVDPHDALVDDAWPRIERARALVERETPGLSIRMHWAPAG